jgi:hypothetical protein
MGKVWLQGVVRDGQVVLTAPLDLPDGTAVIVTDCYELEDDPRPQEPKLKLADEERAEMWLFLDHKKDWALWPEFESRLKEKYGPWLPHHYLPRAA